MKLSTLTALVTLFVIICLQLHLHVKAIASAVTANGDCEGSNGDGHDDDGQCTAPIQALEIVVMSGSLRRLSTNTGLLRAAATLLPSYVHVTWSSIALPLYNGDIEAQGMPVDVRTLWDQLHAADGVLIACPEYNGAMSGILTIAIINNHIIILII
jgi:hypothetical protein